MHFAGFRFEPYMDAATWWVRFDGNPIFIADPLLFWKLRPFANSDLDPNSEDTQYVNSLGYRDDEFNPKKEKGELRIITTGDSCTFGDGVGNWQSYGNILEKSLQSQMPDRKVTVINAGVPGYTSYQILTQLKEELIKLKPDVVTLYVGLNDNIPANDSIPDINRAPKGALLRAFNRIRFLRTVQGLELFVGRYLRPLRQQVVSPDPDHHTFRVPFDQYIENICAIKELGDKNGFKVIIMTLPHQFPDESERNPLIRDASSQCKIPLLDLWTLMKKRQNLGEKMYLSDGGHPNKLGHQRIAWFLQQKLAELNIAPAPPEMQPAPTEPDPEPSPEVDEGN